MSQVTANGITIEYEAQGRRSDPPILLIMGLGAQLTLWPQAFVDTLAAEGLYVVRHDNRDCGLSSDFGGWGRANLPAAIQRMMAGGKVEAPYLLEDMAADALGLMDTLGIARAHIVGASMGGMIAQIIAAQHSARCLSLTSIMSTSSRPGLPPGKPEAIQALLSRPESDDRETLVQYSMKLRRVISGTRFTYTDAELRDIVEHNIDRRYYPEGVGRQYLAILASGSRADLLPIVRVPTLVIHGSEDPLLPLACGRDVADLVPGARVEIFEGMGHDIPPALAPDMARMIARHCRAAAGSAAIAAG